MLRSVCVGLLLGGGLFFLGCESPESGNAGGTDTTASASQVPPDSIRQRVEREIAALNEMRESLASTIEAPVDKSTFQRVCAPVGKRAQELGQETGWTVQQLAEKYRNPAHEPDAEAQRLHDQFAETPEQTDTWIRTVRQNTEGWRYARRIPVQPSCTACHGPKEERPDFVKKGYPDDRAYGFEPGDLRGIYAVFVPDPAEQE